MYSELVRILMAPSFRGGIVRPVMSLGFSGISLAGEDDQGRGQTKRGRVEWAGAGEFMEW